MLRIHDGTTYPYLLDCHANRHMATDWSTQLLPVLQAMGLGLPAWAAAWAVVYGVVLLASVCVAGGLCWWHLMPSTSLSLLLVLMASYAVAQVRPACIQHFKRHHTLCKLSCLLGLI